MLGVLFSALSPRSSCTCMGWRTAAHLWSISSLPRGPLGSGSLPLSLLSFWLMPLGFRRGLVLLPAGPHCCRCPPLCCCLRRSSRLSPVLGPLPAGQVVVARSGLRFHCRCCCRCCRPPSCCCPRLPPHLLLVPPELWLGRASGVARLVVARWPRRVRISRSLWLGLLAPFSGIGSFRVSRPRLLATVPPAAGRLFATAAAAGARGRSRQGLSPCEACCQGPHGGTWPAVGVFSGACAGMSPLLFVSARGVTPPCVGLLSGTTRGRAGQPRVCCQGPARGYPHFSLSLPLLAGSLPPL